MPSPEITVVVTSHNYGCYLEECLRSIDRQTRPPDRLVIVDDASTDDTTDVLDAVVPTLRAPAAVTVHHNAVRLGAAGALNLAINQLVRTPLVVNVDADDIVAERFIEALAKALDRAPRAAYAYPRMQLFGAQTGRYVTHDFDAGRLIFQGNYIPNVALMRRDLVIAAGGYRDLPTHIDWDLWLALLDAGHEGILVDEVLYNWRRHPGAMTYQPFWRLASTRARIQWRHRRLLFRYRSSALRWTAAALRRRLPSFARRGGGTLTPSGWVEPDDNEPG